MEAGDLTVAQRVAALRNKVKETTKFLPADMAEPIIELIDYLECSLEFSQIDLDNSKNAYGALTDKIHALIDCVPYTSGTKAFALPDEPQSRRLLKHLAEAICRI